MSTPPRFEQDLPEVLESRYLAGMPTYRDDLVQRLAATRRRPAWAIRERWFPVDVPMTGVPGRVPVRFLALALIVVALLAAAIVGVVGSQRRLPAPFGPAGNGPLAFSANGDVLVRDGLTGSVRTVIGGGTDDGAPGYSPDGSKLLFTRAVDGKTYIMAANADGSGITRAFPDPVTDASISWAPDSGSIAVIDLTTAHHTLRVARLDGSAPSTVDLGDLQAFEAQWRPPDGRQLVVRVQKPGGRFDLVTVGSDGTGLHAFNLPSPMLFGPQWELTNPVWDPTGRRIAYNSVEHDATANVDHYRIHVIDADGSGDITLPLSSSTTNEAWPAFSPDGRSILAQRFTFTPNAGWLGVIPADGSSEGRDIGPKHFGGDGDTMRQMWSPDGHEVLLRFNTTDFYVIDAESGTVTTVDWPIADLPDWQRVAP
jgi:hypothetical protein